MIRRENHRRLVIGLIGTAVLLSLLVSAGTAVAGNKITICHLTPANGNNNGSPPHDWVVIDISVNAWPMHRDLHGDTEFNGSCGASCEFTAPACDGIDNDCDGLIDESDECSGG